MDQPTQELHLCRSAILQPLCPPRFRREAGLRRQSVRNQLVAKPSTKCLQPSCKRSSRGEARRDRELALSPNGTSSRPRRPPVAASPLKQRWPKCLLDVRDTRSSKRLQGCGLVDSGLALRHEGDRQRSAGRAIAIRERDRRLVQSRSDPSRRRSGSKTRSCLLRFSKHFGEKRRPQDGIRRRCNCRNPTTSPALEARPICRRPGENRERERELHVRRFEPSRRFRCRSTHHLRGGRIEDRKRLRGWSRRRGR